MTYERPNPFKGSIENLDRKTLLKFTAPLKFEKSMHGLDGSLSSKSGLLVLNTLGHLGFKYSPSTMTKLLGKITKVDSKAAIKPFKWGKLAHDVVNPVRLANNAVKVTKLIAYTPEVIADSVLANSKKLIQNSNSKSEKIGKGALLALPVIAAAAVKLPCMAARGLLTTGELGLATAEQMIENPKKFTLGLAKAAVWVGARVAEAAVSIRFIGKDERMSKVNSLVYKKEQNIYNKINAVSDKSYLKSGLDAIRKKLQDKNLIASNGKESSSLPSAPNLQRKNSKTQER
jgi:hypothetical protein